MRIRHKYLATIVAIFIFIGVADTTNAFGGDLLPAYLTEGAIVCPYASSLSDAVMAHSRNDITWFQSTKCSQVSGKPAAVIIDGGTRYAWRVRVPQIEKTVYVPFNHVLANYRGKTMSWQDYHKTVLGKH